jgi:hypothetical protein
VQYISRRRGDNGKTGLWEWEGEKRETESESESAKLSSDLDTLSTVLG